MTILEIRLDDAAWLDPETLQCRLEQSRGVRLKWEQPNSYRASSKRELALNWLKSWYIAESFGRHASHWACTFHEGDFGAGILALDLSVSDINSFAATLADFAEIFDPDDIEASALIYD